MWRDSIETEIFFYYLQNLLMRKINRIVIHCSASNQNLTAADIVAYHLRPVNKGGRGWKRPGYHFIVSADGEVTQSVGIENISNGAKGYNSDSIHVCYIGGIDSFGRATDNRTSIQKRAMLELLIKLHHQFPTAKIVGHRDLSKDLNGNGKIDVWERIKACPCFDATDEYSSITL